MSDYSNLKALAEDAAGISDVSLAPDVVLDLIAEIERGQRMLVAACVSLGDIGEALGAEMDDDADHLIGMIRELKAENERVNEELSACKEGPGTCGYWRDVARAHLAEMEELRKDAERMDRLEMECEAYGSQDIHEGNRWVVDGPFATVRDAIDAAMSQEAQS